MSQDGTETTIGDTDLTEAEILGTHTFEGVLYTGSTQVVNVLTGDTPDELDRSVRDAKRFVQRTQKEGKPPRVAKQQPPERAVESRSPYVSTVFCHMDITGSYEFHQAILAAWRGDEYDVEYTADYYTGTLEINVTRP